MKLLTDCLSHCDSELIKQPVTAAQIGKKQSSGEKNSDINHLSPTN